MGELERSLGARELDEWHIYSSIEPFGAYRDNIHTAMLCSLIANVNRQPKSRPFEWKEFMIVDAETKRLEQGEKTKSFATWLRTVSKPKKA